MEALVIWIVMLLVTIAVAVFFFLIPKISRRGLLFGVYVGEQLSRSEAAQRITRSWYVGMSFWLILSLAAGILAGIFLHPGPASIAALFLLLLGFLIEYLRAYHSSLRLAPATAPLPDVEPQGTEESRPVYLPIAAMLLGLLGGLLAIGYAWSHFAQLPERVPTHFGLSGRPDAWSPRSLATVMLLPVMSLILGIGLGGIAYLIGQAKRSTRYHDQGLSLEAQQSFRQVMANFLAVVAMLTTAMMTMLSIASIQVALKELPTLPAAFMALTVGLLVVAIGGSLYILLRYGQGGSRLEQGAADAPLTNGLADNRLWVLGMFYVNPEDPSIFVEKRFGLGYTINFGNPKAVFIMLGFIGLILLVAVVAFLNK